MIVMISNNSGVQAGMLLGKFPNNVGWMLNTASTGKAKLPFIWNIHWALDNGCYAAFNNGEPWDAQQFEAGLDWALAQPYAPRFVVVPDVVGDARATFKSWDRWADKIRAKGLKVALAAQDGMTSKPVAARNPDIVFVGGSPDWKWSTARRWCDDFERVHVGKVNAADQLKMCLAWGVESVDGTGWFRGVGSKKGNNQLMRLVRFLKENS